jgi:hypothetical protein
LPPPWQGKSCCWPFIWHSVDSEKLYVERVKESELWWKDKREAQLNWEGCRYTMIICF